MAGSLQRCRGALWHDLGAARGCAGVIKNMEISSKNVENSLMCRFGPPRVPPTRPDGPCASRIVGRWPRVVAVVPNSISDCFSATTQIVENSTKLWKIRMLRKWNSQPLQAPQHPRGSDRGCAFWHWYVWKVQVYTKTMEFIKYDTQR